MIPSRKEPMSALALAVISLAAIAEQQPTQRPIALRGCPDKCGNISIPYPFGMAPACFRPGFEVTCNKSFDPPRAFLASGTDGSFQLNGNGSYLSNETTASLDTILEQPVELIDITLERGEARAYGAISTDCATDDTYHVYRRQQTDFSEPFLFSPSRNVLTGIGWDAVVLLSQSLSGTGISVPCLTKIEILPSIVNGSCVGMGCCEVNVTAGSGSRAVIFDHMTTLFRNSTPCSYGMLVERGWYSFSSEDLYGYQDFSRKHERGVPFVIDFAIRDGSSCPARGDSPPGNYACLSGNSSCVNATSGPGYLCRCWEHYDGNPYIPNGCQDIDECELRKQNPLLRDQYPCSSDGFCKNRLGGYDCPCKAGMKGDGKAGTCTEKFPLPAKVAVGAVGALLLVATALFVVLLRIEKRKMRDFFIKNGGPVLEKVKNIQIFKKEELKRITNNYMQKLGEGNFGVVFKGYINGDVPVAVKKSEKINKIQKDQFTNEVIIQSQVIHKNIVRLLGCCLEVDIPILVYEFVSKGSLEDILHGKNKVPLTLDMRLGIAAESAEGLAYMHCKTNTSIQHGDVKPANILLDDNFVPKISDFGISKLLARGTTEHADNVIGDNNYMDPVYRQTGLLTNKSDVYSFGFVLFELITGKKATYGGDGSLAKTYLDTYITEMRERKATELSDEVNEVENDTEVLHNIAQIAKECLNIDVDQRLEMNDVAERLQNIRRAMKKQRTAASYLAAD